MSDHSHPTGKNFPELMTTQEVADALRISVKSVTRLVRDGRLPCFRLSTSRSNRFRRDDVLRLLVPVTTAADDDADLDDFITTNQKG